ncbi:MAG TPA: C4-dicarboxylate ABC transporter substrate-binding protein [Gammaproteobacteria bacterium]|nr:C4-dicarboxylate ABC transporter substrate-binding protein [Gammaproteobacteria bacterium]
MFKKVLVTLTATAVLGAVSVTQAAQNLILAHIGISDSAHELAATTVITQIARRLPGRFKIENKGGSTLGGEVDIWEGVKLGTVDLAILTTGAITPSVPPLGVLSVPFLFRDSDHAGKVLNGPMGQELGASLKTHGVVFLGFAEHGFRHLSNSKRPVQRPEDLAGLRIRVIPNPIYEMTFKALGAEVVPMAWPTVYGALDDGRIDGQENPLLTFSGSHFERVQKHLTLTGHIYSGLVILVNADIYQQMKPDERQALSEAAHAAGEETRPVLVARDQAIVAKLRQKGVAVVETLDRPAFVKAVKPLWPTWEKRFGASLLQRIRDTQ